MFSLNNVNEITTWRYNNDRRDKDRIIAETKIGYIRQHSDNIRYAYVKLGNKCYCGALAQWQDALDFQQANFNRIVVNTSISFVDDPNAEAA